jgi:hypothetical protein
MMRNVLRTVFVGAVAWAACAGCSNEDSKNYDVTIAWTVGGGTDCSWLVQGVTTPLEDVTVTVYDAEGDAEPLSAAVTVPCSDLTYTIPRLKRGNYFVEVQAWGEYDGQQLPILADAKEIKAPYKDGDDTDFLLVLATGDIHVTWSFANGFGCEYNDATNVEISLAAGETVECGPQEYTVEGQTAFQEYSVSVDALNDADDVIFSGSCADNPFVLLPGETYDANVVLE